MRCRMAETNTTRQLQSFFNCTNAVIHKVSDTFMLHSPKHLNLPLIISHQTKRSHSKQPPPFIFLSFKVNPHTNLVMLISILISIHTLPLSTKSHYQIPDHTKYTTRYFAIILYIWHILSATCKGSNPLPNDG